MQMLERHPILMMVEVSIVSDLLEWSACTRSRNRGASIAEQLAILSTTVLVRTIRTRQI